MSSKITIQLALIFALISLSVSQGCHPQCSWKCDDPRCDAVCQPVCEPPKCHSSCQEPKNAVCDVKCEKPDCQIYCPDKACAGVDCPKCVTVCKAPHCVTHCQSPKPECEAVCDEPKCDWKCHKPECPKPKCELVCENPGCKPQTECCKCESSQLHLQLSSMFFKEFEKDPRCCSCNKDSIQVQVPQTKVSVNNFEKLAQPSGNQQNYVSQSNTQYSVEALAHPQRIGPSYYEKPQNLLNRVGGQQ